MTTWTRRAASQTRDELAAWFETLGDDTILARSIGPAQSVRLIPLPEPGPTAWQAERNGHAPLKPWPGHAVYHPAAAYCGECGRPSLLQHRGACRTHRVGGTPAEGQP